MAFGVAANLTASPLVFDLWPDGIPLTEQQAKKSENVRTEKNGNLHLTSVSWPQITVYRPDDPNGAAVLVCPGGGLRILAYEHECTDVCEFLSRHGVTAILLKYRVPTLQKILLQDAQRAIELVHHHADEWGIDAARIGMLGFSAGGI